MNLTRADSTVSFLFLHFTCDDETGNEGDLKRGGAWIQVEIIFLSQCNHYCYRNGSNVQRFRGTRAMQKITATYVLELHALASPCGT